MNLLLYNRGTIEAKKEDNYCVFEKNDIWKFYGERYEVGNLWYYYNIIGAEE